MRNFYGELENMIGQLIGYKYQTNESIDEETEDLYFAMQERLLNNEEVVELRLLLKERAMKMIRAKMK